MRVKKGITGEELGGERRKRLHANPTILEICVYPRMQLLIGAVLALVMLIIN